MWPMVKLDNRPHKGCVLILLAVAFVLAIVIVHLWGQLFPQ